MKVSAVTFTGEPLRQEIQQRGERIAAVATAAPIRLPDFPAMVLGAVLLLAGLAGARSWHRFRGSPPLVSDRVSESPPVAGRVRWEVFSTIVLTVLYVGSLQLGWPGFVSATFFYTICLGAMLAGQTVGRHRASWRRAGPTIVAVAMVMSIGMHHLLTRVLVVDLP